MYTSLNWIKAPCVSSGAESDGDDGLVAAARNSVDAGSVQFLEFASTAVLSSSPRQTTSSSPSSSSISTKMLGARLAPTCQAILRSPFSFNPARSFSMSPIVEAGYKLKSHSGAKKRWRSLGASSVFKRVRLYRDCMLSF